MRVDDILQDFVAKKLSLNGLRATKIKAVTDMVHSLLRESSLTVTSLGINMYGKAKQRNKIKRVDRWLSNDSLYNNLHGSYAAIFNNFLSTRRELDILVDWSGCCNWEQCCIRASVVFSGRSITIYQEIYDSKLQQKPEIHQAFLKNLHKIIPNQCRVTIITDRGFQTKWFEMVKKMGWDFIGRCNPSYCYKLEGTGIWKPIKHLYSCASTRPSFLDRGRIGKGCNLPAFIYTYNAISKKRKGKRAKNKPCYPQLEKIYQNQNTSPWVIVTSHPPEKRHARQIINNYHSRMQIEQNFRDDKSERFGYGFRFGRTRSVKRLSILYFIAAICSFILMIIGAAVEQSSFRWDYQASSIKHKRSISLLTLAKRILKEGLEKIPRSQLIEGFLILAREPKLCYI